MATTKRVIGDPIPIFPEATQATARSQHQREPASECKHPTTLTAQSPFRGVRVYCRTCGADLGPAAMNTAPRTKVTP